MSCMPRASLSFVLGVIGLIATVQSAASGVDSVPSAIVDDNALHDPAFHWSGKSAEFNFEHRIVIDHLGAQDGMMREYVITPATSTASVIDLMDHQQSNPQWIFIIQLEKPYVKQIEEFIRDQKHSSLLAPHDSEWFQGAVFRNGKNTDHRFMTVSQAHALFLLLSKIARRDRRHGDEVKKAFDLYLPYFANRDPKK